MGNEACTRQPVIKLATRRFEVKVGPLRGSKVKRNIVRSAGPNADRNAVPLNMDGPMNMAAYDVLHLKMAFNQSTQPVGVDEALPIHSVDTGYERGVVHK